jgi:galactose mutarotase-like enzyme
MNFSIKNDKLEASFLQNGAELCSLRHREHHMEYIWEANPDIWGRHAPLLFPIVGRLANDTLHHRGRSYHLPQHGFARNQQFHVVRHEERQIAFELFSNPEIADAYPYFFRLEVIYTLIGSELRVRYQVDNRDDKDIFFSIGGHPAFRCPLKEGEQRHDYHLEFSAEEHAFSQTLENGLRTEELRPILDHTRHLPLTDELFDRDALIFESLRSNAVSLCKGEQAVLTLHFPDFPYLGVWSKSRTAPFVCLEPWYGIADRVSAQDDFAEKEGILMLSREESFACEYIIQIH